MESARSCIVREGEGREAGVEEQSNKGRYLMHIGKRREKKRGKAIAQRTRQNTLSSPHDANASHRCSQLPTTPDTAHTKRQIRTIAASASQGKHDRTRSYFRKSILKIKTVLETYPTTPTMIIGGVSTMVTGSTTSFLWDLEPGLSISRTMWVIPAL